MVFVGVLGLVLSYLLAVVNVNGGDEGEQEVPRGFWKRKSSSCYKVLLTMFPLTSIKIVVVVWQILTQVNVVWRLGSLQGLSWDLDDILV